MRPSEGRILGRNHLSLAPVSREGIRVQWEAGEDQRIQETVLRSAYRCHSPAEALGPWACAHGRSRRLQPRPAASAVPQCCHCSGKCGHVPLQNSRERGEGRWVRSGPPQAAGAKCSKTIKASEIAATKRSPQRRNEAQASWERIQKVLSQLMSLRRPVSGRVQ